MVRGDRFMLLVIAFNLGCCIFHFLEGETQAFLGWLVGLMWSVRTHSLEIRLREMKDKGKDEGGELFGFDDHDV